MTSRRWPGDRGQQLIRAVTRSTCRAIYLIGSMMLMMSAKVAAAPSRLARKGHTTLIRLGSVRPGPAHRRPASRARLVVMTGSMWMMKVTQEPGLHITQNRQTARRARRWRGSEGEVRALDVVVDGGSTRRQLELVDTDSPPSHQLYVWGLRSPWKPSATTAPASPTTRRTVMCLSTASSATAVRRRHDATGARTAERRPNTSADRAGQPPPAHHRRRTSTTERHTHTPDPGPNTSPNITTATAR